MDDVKPRVREAHNSKEYCDEGLFSIYDSFPAVYETVPTETTEEDVVVLNLGDEQYKIYPKNRKRVKVVRYKEARTNKSKPKNAESFNDFLNGHDLFPRIEASGVGFSDKERVKRVTRLLALPRATPNPAVWAELERLRQEPQQIIIQMPLGHTFSRPVERQINQLVQHLIKGETNKALVAFTKIQAKIDPNKVIEDHPVVNE